MEKYQFDNKAKEILEKLRLPLAVYQFIDKRVVTVLLSDGFCELFGFEDKDEAYYLMDNDMYKSSHPDDKARIADKALQFASEGEKYDIVYRTRTRKSSQYMIIHAVGEHVYTEDGVKLAYVWYTDEGIYTEENDTRSSTLNSTLSKSLKEEGIINTIRYDFLTGLPSMTYFFELAEEWRNNRINAGGKVALLFMDLCGMKYFNRKYGFAEGDKLLRRFADILKKHFSNENCSRFGSDHFCIFTDPDGIEDKLKEIFKEFNSRESLPVHAGIYLDENDSHEISAECDRAKYACDTLRNNYLSTFLYFSPDMQKQVENRNYIIDNIDRAIEENQTLRLQDSTIVMRPLYNSVAAGFGAVPQNNVVGYIPTNIKVLSEKDLYIWIMVDGDSMAPTIEDGSEILVRKQSSVDSGQIAVVLIDGEEAVVKRVVYGADWIELLSVNPYYPPRRFEGPDVQRITVLGLVKKVSMTLN